MKYLLKFKSLKFNVLFFAVILTLIIYITKYTNLSFYNVNNIYFYLLIIIVPLSILINYILYRQTQKHNKELEKKTVSLNKLLENFDKHVIASKTDNNGVITYVSEAFCEVSGFSKEELIGKSQNIGRHPDMSSSFFKNLWNTISTGKEWEGEIQNVKKDGSAYWVYVQISPELDINGDIIGYSAIRHDISSEKKLKKVYESLEKTVKDRTKELSKAQKIGKIGDWQLDLRDKSFKCSDQVYKIFAVNPFKFVTISYEVLQKYIHPNDIKNVYKMYEQAIRDKSDYKVQHRIVNNNGTVVYVEVLAEQIFDENSNVIGSFGTIQDITDITVAKLELEKINLKLEDTIGEAIAKYEEQQKYLIKQSKMAAMGEMISMIAHQWRQPLASISAISGTLTIDSILNEYRQEYFQEKLESITDIAHHLSSTIDDFRSFFKENKEVEKISTDNLLDDSLKIINPIFKTKGIEIKRNCDNFIVSTYSNEVKQVILNILKNAEEALVEKNISEKMIEIKCYEKEENVYITIEDNGGGIPDEIIEKVFEPYFSTKDKKDGTGLGLYMSKTIIEEHCLGSLSVFNKNQGALFEIVLPLNKAS